MKDTANVQCDANNCGDEYPVEVEFDMDYGAVIDITVLSPLRCPTCNSLINDDVKVVKDIERELNERHAPPSREDERDAQADINYHWNN